MVEYSELLLRIDRLSARASRADHDSVLLAEIEDVLAEGYLYALAEEARSQRLESRLEDLVETLDDPGAAVEARRIATQRRSLEQQIGTLRSRLGAMREHFIRLGGTQSVHG